MIKLVKRALIAMAVILTGVGMVVVIRTMAATSVQVIVKPVDRISIDETAIERFAGAIRIKTVSRAEAPNSDPAALEEFHRHLQTCFPKVHAALSPQVVGGHSLLCTWKGTDESAKPVLLMAHMDVVPVEPGTESSWTHGPFSGKVADGFVWGRGTIDDKVSVMAILEAVESLLARGFRPAPTILLAFGHDEEIGGHGGAAQIAALLKTRGTRIRYVLDEGSVVTDGIVPGLSSPAALIGIGEKGFVSLELRAVAPAGHSSMPPPQTAIGIVAAAVRALENHPMPAALDGPAALLFDRLSPEMPFLTRLPLANRWLFGPLIVSQLEKAPTTNAILRTTTAATIFEGGVKDNVLPAHSRAVINFRIKTGETVNEAVSHATKVVNDSRVKIRVLEPESAKPPSPQSSTHSRAFQTIEQTIRQVMPEAIVAPSLVVSATDTGHYQELADDIYRFIPVVFGPDDPARLHGTNERIAVDGYRNCVRFYVQLLINESQKSGLPTKD
jgi:carboxypeptidase PM20D1